MMRSFDGLHYALSSGAWNFTAVSAIPTRGVFQVDGWGWVKTPVTYVSVTHETENGEDQPHAEWRLFGIYYNDDRGVVKTDNRPASVRATDLSAINLGTYGGHVIAALTDAAPVHSTCWVGALYRAEAGGRRISAHPRSRVKRAINPIFGNRVRPWIRGGYFYSSGDGNPNDQCARDIFCDFADTARLCKISVLQRNE